MPLMSVVQGIYVLITCNVILRFPWQRVQTQQPKPDVFNPVEINLRVVLYVIIFGHPPGLPHIGGVVS